MASEPKRSSPSADELPEAKRHKTEEVPEKDYETKPESSKKRRALPGGLLIKASGSFEFVPVTANQTAPNYIGGNIGILPCSSVAMALDFCLYADDEGMIKNLPMNCMINPFMSARDICYYASIGGPYGDVLLVSSTVGDTKRHRPLQYDTLLRMCSNADARDGYGETPFQDALLEALERWQKIKEQP